LAAAGNKGVKKNPTLSFSYDPKAAERVAKAIMDCATESDRCEFYHCYGEDL